MLTGLRQRRRHHIHQCRRLRAADCERLQHRDHIRRTARLRRGERQITFHLPRRRQHTTERRRQRRHRHPARMHQYIRPIPQGMIGRTASDRNHAARRAGLQRFSKRQRGRKILRGNPFSGFARFLQHKRHRTPHKNQYTTTAKRDKHWVSRLPLSGTKPDPSRTTTKHAGHVQMPRTAVHHNATPAAETNCTTAVQHHGKTQNLKTKQKQMKENPPPYPKINHRKFPLNSQNSTKILTP